MSENKTKATTTSVQAFLKEVANETRRNDSYVLLKLFQKITGHPPVLWGTSLIGFDRYHYTYDTGREGDMMLAGFSPRKQHLAIYNTGFKRYPELMDRLGRYKAAKSCFYITKLSDIDIDVLSELIKSGYDHMKNKYNS